MAILRGRNHIHPKATNKMIPRAVPTVAQNFSDRISIHIIDIYFSDLLFQKLPLIREITFYDSTVMFCYARTRIIKYSAINIFKDFQYNYLLARKGAKEGPKMSQQQYSNIKIKLFRYINLIKNPKCNSRSQDS